MNEHLENLKEIRALMERSSKFLSLSGLSGVSAGIIAIIAAYMTYRKKVELTGNIEPKGIFEANSYTNPLEFKAYIINIAVVTLVLAVIAGIYFTVRKARQSGEKVWNNLSKKLTGSMLFPLITGGLFCIGLISHGVLWVVPSTTLVFYGLALVNASKYTVRDVYYLGVSEIVLGLLSMVLTGYSLIFWTLGFGVLHIAYGTVMYFKYEK